MMGCGRGFGANKGWNSSLWPNLRTRSSLPGVPCFRSARGPHRSASPCHEVLASAGSCFRFSFLSCAGAMTRPFSSAVWFTILCVLPSLVTAHIIHVAAAQKDCYFEDLHKNDKVDMHLGDLEGDMLTECVDDSHIPSRRRRTLRHRFLGACHLSLYSMPWLTDLSNS